MQVNMHDAKSNLSKLVSSVQKGGIVTIAKDGKPVARIVPIKTTGKKIFGSLESQVKFAADYDRADQEVEKLFS